MKSLLGIVRRPDVIFRSDGHFDLKARVVRALNITSGDVVDILSSVCGEYYLYVAHRTTSDERGRFEAQCFPSNRSGALHFRGSSVRLCSAMLEACNATGRVALACGDVIIDDRGRHLLPIITRLNLVKK